MTGEISIVRYSSTKSREWDRFVEESVNGTFLLKRPYMDYHSERFTDHSLMAYDDRGRLAALLPAAADGDTLSSHPGLTYGGWIVGTSGTGPAVMLEIFSKLKEYMTGAGFARLVYKPTPGVYHRYPCEDDIYALFRHGARMTGCMVSSAFPVDRPLLMTGNNRRCADHLCREGYRVSDLTDDRSLAEFWRLLNARLREAHNVPPVHSSDELQLLHRRFPDEIRLLSVRDNEGTMIAATLVFFTSAVAHTQYIATTEEGRRRNCMTLIIRRLTEIARLRPWIRYVDFGVSCERWGLVLNEGLASQKRNLGGRSNIYSRYEWTIGE